MEIDLRLNMGRINPDYDGGSNQLRGGTESAVEVNLRSQFESRKTALLYKYMIVNKYHQCEKETKERRSKETENGERTLDEAKERAFQELRKTFGDEMTEISS